jgi:catechol 2,3-dioxygenase-like lactoylglutathione lyase family enzyme
MMLSGRTGVAIFPSLSDTAESDVELKTVKIDHFAFRVTNDSFDRAIEYFDHLNIPYKIQDHIYFKSIYIRDPDNHEVELTTLTDIEK